MKTTQSKMVPPIFIGRWTPKILFSVKEKAYRHGQLCRHLVSVSQRMLTRALRDLESTGLIARRLTRLGKTIISTARDVSPGKQIPQGCDC